MLSWGIFRMERIYQYPFFMGIIFVSFLIPQAISLTANPGLLSQQALERVLLMSALCSAACWLGYQGEPNARWLAMLNVNIDKNKLFRVGILLMLVGYFFHFLIRNTNIERSEYNNNWTGPATIYIFFGQVIYIAFSIFILEAVKNPSIKNIFFTLLAAWIPLQRVLAGRRQTTMLVFITIGLSFWLIRRYLPPRWLIIVSIFLVTILIPTLGVLRERFWEYLLNGQWQELLSNTQKALQRNQESDILELRNAGFFMDATVKLNLYGFGSGFWDAIVFQYVPGQLLGFGFKQSLQFNLITEQTLFDIYGYRVHIGTTTTGIADSFMEFGYLGCLLFGLIAYFFKHLWISSLYQESTFSYLLYMALVSPAMLGLTHGIGRFLQESSFFIAMIILTGYFAKETKTMNSVKNKYIVE
jgi:hypothetical protein